MNKFAIFVLLVSIVFSGISFAAQPNRGFMGDNDGYIMLTTENNIQDYSRSIYKSEFSIYRKIPLGTIFLQPFYYFKNEAQNNFMGTASLTENNIGADFVLQQNEMEMFAIGVGYKTK